MKRFIINIAGISVALALIGWLVFSQFIPEYYLPVFPFLLLFFAGSSVLIHAYQLQLVKKDMAKFTRSNMLITFFKLVLYSAVTIIYITVDTKNAKVFVICFMMLYLIFTIFEVYSLIKITTNNKKKG
jgi:Mn2+/Fe2+ NRAMP family transporter